MQIVFPHPVNYLSDCYLYHPYAIQHDQNDRWQHVDGLDGLELEQVQTDGENDNASYAVDVVHHSRRSKEGE